MPFVAIPISKKAYKVSILTNINAISIYGLLVLPSQIRPTTNIIDKINITLFTFFQKLILFIFELSKSSKTFT